ncbi:hypothetical protein EN852_036960 [Mesorhizobium sp. M2E.F.Ca.ET.209.01.1.1]|uniref:hypothetical protein n=1 Tax=Mesorhizobium sp. M2E.F.Ca.ET.209.01.1.1 TaxID=2500526 RepID=UPI0010923011|nr:hypothetical protein [Mesorhizobium sp. M2E.F.Ca.ET.209.01.1.1]TGR96002.1 hypothetical protein EN852_036960 [Mesorhizobium sp. M2E.F.Ca.ET.209.01.1.1]
MKQLQATGTWVLERHGCRIVVNEMPGGDYRYVAKVSLPGETDSIKGKDASEVVQKALMRVEIYGATKL